MILHDFAASQEIGRDFAWISGALVSFQHVLVERLIQHDDLVLSILLDRGDASKSTFQSGLAKTELSLLEADLSGRESLHAY